MKVLLSAIALMFFAVIVSAQSPVPATASSPVPAVSAAPAVPAPTALDDMSFLQKVMGFIQGFGGLSAMAKISGIILLIIATMKTTFLAPIWAKLGNLGGSGISVQAWIAPILGLVAGILSLGSSLSWQAALAYIGSGAGAIILHQLLDDVKSWPGLGAAYVAAINFVENSVIGSGGQPPAAA